MKKIKKKNKTIKKPIIMIIISLLLIFFVNNSVFEIYDCMDYLMGRVEARRVSIDMTNWVYDDVKDELLDYFNSNEMVLNYCDTDIPYPKEVGERYGLHGMGIEVYMQNVMEPYMFQDIGELADDEIIICKYITKDGDGHFGKTMEYVDGEQFIGQEVTMYIRKLDWLTRQEIERKEYTFTVVGVYDNVNAGDYAGGLVNENVAKEMMEYSFLYTENMKQTENYYKYEPEVIFEVIVDKYENVQNVLQDINDICEKAEDDFYIVQTKVKMSEEGIMLLEGIRLICNFVAIYVVICAIINIFSYVKENMERRKREFGIMKAIGYRTGRISLILLKETAIEAIIPLVITMIWGNGIFMVVNNYIQAKFSIYWNMIKFEMNGYVTLAIVFIATLVPLMGYIWGLIKLHKLEPMEALR